MAYNERQSVRGAYVTDVLFFTAYIIYFTITFLDQTMFSALYPSVLTEMAALGAVFLVLVRELLKDRMSVREYLWLILLAFFCVMVVKDSSRKYDIAWVILIYGARDIPFRRIAKISVICSSVLLAATVICAHAGIILNYYEYWNGRTRHYLGFRYCLFGPTVLFNIIVLLGWLYKDKIRWILLLVLTALGCLFYELTDSRLCFVLSLVFLVAIAVLKIWPELPRHLKPLQMLMTISFPVCFAVSVGVSCSYQPYGWMKSLNEKLVNRLYYGSRAIREYGISWFGQRITFHGNGLTSAGKKVSSFHYSYVDCLYLQVLLRYGIIFSVIVLVLLTLTMIYLYRKKEYYLLFIFFLLAVHAMIDDLIFYICYNTFWFVISSALWNRKAYKPEATEEKLLLTESSD